MILAKNSFEVVKYLKRVNFRANLVSQTKISKNWRRLIYTNNHFCDNQTLIDFIDTFSRR